MNCFLNSKFNAWQTYRELFLGTVKFQLHFGSINNGVIRSTAINIPWLQSEVTVNLTELNIGGLGNIALDYKYAVLSDASGLYVECMAEGANGTDILQNQTVTCVFTITRKN